MPQPVLYAADGRPANATSTVPAPTAADRRLLTRPIETSMTRGYAAVLAALPEADEIVLHEGPDVYDRMRADDAVFAAEFQLMSRILGRPWDVRPPEVLAGDKLATDVAEYVKSVVAAMNVDQMTEHLYRALRYRHSGGQLVYRQEGSTLVPAEFIAEPRSVFRFGRRGACFVVVGGEVREADPYKWVWHVNEPDPERVGGRSVFSRVYYPWKFKRVGWELWVSAMERFAVPSLAALFELAGEDADKAKEIAEALNKQLLQIASGSVGSLANVKSLQTIGGAKAVEGFDTFCEMCDRSIYRGLLTTTLTVSEGKEGAERGNTQVADETADQVAYHYARHLGQSISRQLCAYAALLRFGEAARTCQPVFEFDFEEPISSERLLKFMEQGVPVSRRALYSRHGLPEPTDERDAFVSPRFAQQAPPPPQGAGTRPGAVAVLEVPERRRAEAERRMFTLYRDEAIVEAFEALREEGATWDEALSAMETDERWSLSRSSLKNIIIKARKVHEQV